MRAIQRIMVHYYKQRLEYFSISRKKSPGYYILEMNNKNPIILH